MTSQSSILRPDSRLTAPSIPSPVVVIHGGPTIINAPASSVFRTFTDVTTWPKWNSFTPKCEIFGYSHGQKNVEARDELGGRDRLDVGALTKFRGPIGPFSYQLLALINRVVTPEAGATDLSQSPSQGTADAPLMYAINWCNPSFRTSWIPSFMFRFERTHEIRILNETC